MRLHTDTLTYSDITDALQAEKDAGRIARTVTFKMLSEHKSQSHTRAFEVQLESWAAIPGDGRRRGNSGSYGAMSDEDGYAATYDEWGWLMAALYRSDPEAVWGSVKHPQYASATDFHAKTGETYTLAALAAKLDAGTDPFPYVAPRQLKARQGAGRYATPINAWGREYTRHAPRTAAEYRAFAKI